MVNKKLSIILPAKNEAQALERLLPELKVAFTEAEIIIVDDGSTDATPQICSEHHVICVSHPYSMGNGAAIKSGARHAQGEILVFMDADGQHKIEDINRLLKTLDDGFDMAVGARDAKSQANPWRHFGNWVYNKLATWVTGHKILDLTSGFRAVKAEKFREFLHLLPNGFSYPTTITMAFFRSGYTVAYAPINALTRTGKSHLKPFTDGMRFIVIIVKIAALYSPLKLFAPMSLLLMLAGLGNYAYSFMHGARFSNMSALMILLSVTVFLLGLVAEQLTVLMYAMKSQERHP